MSLVSTLQFITGHPLNRHRKASALLDFAKWQLGARLVPGRVVYPWIEGSRFIVRLGETGLTGNMYCGLHEFADMAYLLHTTSAEDLFVDIGANVGSYTLLACAVRGARGICFEPVPETYRRLLDNIRLNDIADRVQALNLGLAEQPGELRFTVGENCMNHVLADDEDGAAIKVDVLTLDTALNGERPSLIKIDVEGFETSVIKGATETLERPSLHSVIMELGGMGARYGFDEKWIHATMLERGFETYAYDPFTRKLSLLDGRRNPTGNSLFIRDLREVQRRIVAAARVTVAGIQI